MVNARALRRRDWSGAEQAAGAADVTEVGGLPHKIATSESRAVGHALVTISMEEPVFVLVTSASETLTEHEPWNRASSE